MTEPNKRAAIFLGGGIALTDSVDEGYIISGDSIQQSVLASAENALKGAYSALHELAKFVDLEKSKKLPKSSYILVNGRRVLESELILKIAFILYKNRRNRDKLFSNSTLFGEPAWDLLLDLMIADMSGKAITVTSACIGACAPTTTALRWLAELECQGLAIRQVDHIDKRRTFVRITETGNSKMRSYCLSVYSDLKIFFDNTICN